MYEYKAIVVNVVDGDTVDLDIDLGFGTWIKNERVRLTGIDTAESRTRNLTEKSWGLAAKQRIIDLTSSEEFVILKTLKDETGKYGRVLGTLYTPNGVNINELLVEEHFAVPYTGGNRDENRELHNIWEYWNVDYTEWSSNQ